MFKIKKLSPTMILKKYNCMKCHKMINSLNSSPSLIDISKRYKNKNKIKKYLFNKIKFGGKGKWGDSYMPSFNIKKIYIYKLINWIIKLKYK